MAMKPDSRHRSPNGTLRPYKDKSGSRWVAPGRFIRPDGTTLLIRGTGATRQQAEDRLRANLAKKARAVAVITATGGEDISSVGGYLQHWLDNVKKPTVAYSTAVGYQNAMDRWIAPNVGRLPLGDLSVEHLEALHATVMAAGRSRSSWVQVRTVLKQALDLAVKRGHIHRNPAALAPQPGKVVRSLEYLTAAESKAVVAACDEPAEKARWLIALSMGLRQGEALALRWSDLDLDAKVPVMRVERSLGRQTGVGLVVGPTKSERSRRTIQVPVAIAEVLRRHRSEQRQSRLALGLPWNPEHYVFGTHRGTPIDPANDRKSWLRLLDRAGVREVRLHAARHTAASLMIGGGTDIHVVSSALGHASISTTADIYGHVPGHTVGAAVETVATMLVS